MPAALAVGEATGASGLEVLSALILGDDLAARPSLGAKYTPGSGRDSPGLVNKFAVAAITARLTELAESGLHAALGLVLNQLAGSFQTIDAGATAFKLAQGLAARDGIEAAELAALDWTAGADPLFSKGGYIDLYCEGVDLAGVLADLGDAFHGDSTFKPYPTCRFVHSTIDASLELREQLRVSGEIALIDSIVIDVAPMHIGSPLDQDFNPGAYPKGHAIFSLAYGAANALVRGRAGLAEYSTEAVTDGSIAPLAKKVTVTGGQSALTPEACVVSVHLNDGRVVSSQRSHASGHPLHFPLTQTQIFDKFRANCDYSGLVTSPQAEALIEMVLTMETLGSLEPLVDLATLR